MDSALQVARAFLGRGPAVSASVDLASLQREGLLGLYYQLAGRTADLLPAVGRDGRMRSLLQELDQGLRQPAVVFKGAAYLGRLYGLGQRHVGDLDLVGGPETRQELERLGFRPVSESPLVLQRGGHQVDLHTHPLGRQQQVTRWDLACARRQSVPLFEGARCLRRFHDRDEAVLCLLHGAKHAFSRLLWLVDLALLQPDPAYLRWLGAERYGWYGAWLLERLFDIPGEVGPLRRTERWFLRRVEQRRAPEELGMLLPLHTLPGVLPKLRYLRETLRSPGGWRRRLTELAAMLARLQRS